MKKVLIDARLRTGKNGGVEQALEGFLNQCKKVDHEFIFYIMLSGKESLSIRQLAQSLGVVIEQRETYPQTFRSLVKFLISLLNSDRIYEKYLLQNKQLPPEPKVLSEIQPDIVYFPLQFGFQTNRINIFSPHDFQHLELPENFTQRVLLRRKYVYNFLMSQATKISVGTSYVYDHGKSNFPEYYSKFFNLPIVPYFSNTTSYTDTSKELSHSKIKNFGRYWLYPAAPWAHKNHAALLEVFQNLRQNGLVDYLVLVGAGNFTEKSLKRLNLRSELLNNIKVFGYVEPTHLAELYKGAQIIVMPSKYESESLVLWEAMRFGVPFACSSLPTINSQIGIDLSFTTFNPENVQDIENVISAIITNPILQGKIRELGKRRIETLLNSNAHLGLSALFKMSLNENLTEAEKEWLKSGFRI